MNDLRHDPDAPSAWTRGKTYVTPTDDRHDQEAADERTHYNLRTVKMPDLRSGECRKLDAAARGLDCRTADDKLRAELVRIVDCLQAVSLRLEIVEGNTGAEATAQAWEIAKLRYYVEALEQRTTAEQRQAAVTEASAALAQHNPPAWVVKRGGT